MCEMCEKRKAAMRDELPEEHVKAMTEKLKEWANKVIEPGSGLEMISSGRQGQEDAAMLAACGITLRRAWEIYTELHKGQGLTLSPEEAAGFGKWITVMARSRAELAMKLQEAIETLQLAKMLEEIRQAEEGPRAGASKPALPMVDLGYGFAGGGGKGGPKRDN